MESQYFRGGCLYNSCVCASHVSDCQRGGTGMYGTVVVAETMLIRLAIVEVV